MELQVIKWKVCQLKLKVLHWVLSCYYLNTSAFNSICVNDDNMKGTGFCN